MANLILSDGTEFACDWCGAANGVLTFNLTEETDFTHVVDALDDPRRTACIAFVTDHDTTYCGYTQIVSIQRDGWPTGGLLVSMTQGEG